MLAVTIVFGVLFLIFSGVFIFQCVETANITKQLKRQTDEKRTQIVTTSFPSKQNQALVGEINRLLDEKLKSEQEQRANGLKLQEAISNVSHDMRTPLTAILGYIHLVNTEEMDEQTKAKYLSTVERRARTLHELISDFYDLSRLDEGTYSLTPAPADVNELCREYIADNYDALTEEGTKLEIDLPSTAETAEVDVFCLQRVLQNILFNAKKHGIGAIRVTGREEQPAVYALCISNDCKPMTDEQLARVFERSYIADSSRPQGNTGLGLALSKTLIEKMNHRITADYKDGKFSVTVYFNLIEEN